MIASGIRANTTEWITVLVTGTGSRKGGPEVGMKRIQSWAECISDTQLIQVMMPTGRCASESVVLEEHLGCGCEFWSLFSCATRFLKDSSVLALQMTSSPQSRARRLLSSSLYNTVLIKITSNGLQEAKPRHSARCENESRRKWSEKWREPGDNLTLQLFNVLLKEKDPERGLKWRWLVWLHSWSVSLYT